MPIGQRIESFLMKHLEYVDIKNSDGSLYLRRFFLLGRKSGSSVDSKKDNAEEKNGKTLILHIFYSSDEGTYLHDQKSICNFVVCILAGGYYEKTEVPFGLRGDGSINYVKISKWYRPGRLLFRKAEWKHQVILANDTVEFNSTNYREFRLKTRRAWTLVFSRPIKITKLADASV